jgi:hypothetical protein
LRGFVGGNCRFLGKLQNLLESRVIEGDSPVSEMNQIFLDRVPKYCGTREIPPESRGTIS